MPTIGDLMSAGGGVWGIKASIWADHGSGLSRCKESEREAALKIEVSPSYKGDTSKLCYDQLPVNTHDPTCDWHTSVYRE